ncbi:MAG: TetR/AcrR family transcriptional regulator [Myxococcota bacterium]|nr:TetR/AcrR family transcriptional regulator [Myxococcota bacterium]
MKVSQEQKVEIRRKLLSAAVALFTEKGFSGATMRAVSTRAGFSPGTIYRYFPTKEKIFYAYFEQKQDELEAALNEIEDFNDYTLKEKLQMMMETQLEVYTPDREFVEVTFRALLDSPMKSFTELQPTKGKFTKTVQGYFAQGVERKDIPEQPFENFLVHLFWDYKNLMVMYWLRDETPAFTNTSRLIDLSLDIYVDLLKSGIITKTADTISFLVKSHLYGNIERLYDFVGLITRTAGFMSRSSTEECPHE